MILRRRTTILVSVILLFACANVFGPRLFWNVAGWDLLQYCALFATGGLVAEACLLAIWAALGAQRAILRIPLTVALVLVAGCSYVIGLKLPADDLPMDVAVFMIAAGLLIYGCMQVPLWGLRVITQQQIDLPHKTGGAATARRSTQFGLRHLLIAMAMVGILLVLVKQALPQPYVALDHTGWLVIFACGFVFIVFSAFICLPCVSLALRRNTGRLWTAALLLPVLGGPPLAYIAVRLITEDASEATEVVLGIYAFGLGTATTVMLVLLIARAIGYRLISPADNLVERPVNEGSEFDAADD
jgi:hypothetical protein